MNTYADLLQHNNNYKILLHEAALVRAAREAQAEQKTTKKNVFVQLLTLVTRS